MIQILVNGIMLIWFAGRVVAIVDAKGIIIDREIDFPIDTIEFIINKTDHSYRWN